MVGFSSTNENKAEWSHEGGYMSSLAVNSSAFISGKMLRKLFEEMLVLRAEKQDFEEIGAEQQLQ